MLTDIEDEETPLQKRLGELGKIVAIICIAVCFIVAGAGILKGEPVFDMLMTGITIAIAAIPEGLPATVTIALALAVNRMLSKNALVHKLHSVETLGCTSVICTDKTGTITENKMTVRKAWTDEGEYDFRVRATAVGEISAAEKISSQKCPPSPCAKCSAAECSATMAILPPKIALQAIHLTSANGQPQATPTETALLIAAAKGGMSHSAERTAFRRLDEIPFDSDTRRMTVTVRTPSGDTSSYTKGAADIILSRCTEILTSGGVKPLGYSTRKG